MGSLKATGLDYENYTAVFIRAKSVTSSGGESLHKLMLQISKF